MPGCVLCADAAGACGGGPGRGTWHQRNEERKIALVGQR